MATTFQTMNVSIAHKDHKSEVTTPTASRVTFESPTRRPETPPAEDSGRKTPTRLSFAESNGKRALPVSPLDNTFAAAQLPQNQDESASSVKEESHSHKRNQSVESQQDVDMELSDEGEDVSDTESVDDENGRPSKKKKGQRFFCTDYPPCNLSFTRSEHLARHIRKHTGERPFQCHCARRFSRLDNLRQHAQTVHVNEEIPGDSLAATGTRFQRQIRTDRVRPQGVRSRASTAGSTGSHGRGHSRNLSSSSITSTTSTMSTMSNLSSLSRDNSQRRPQPLMMADQSPRARLSIDINKASPQGAFGYHSQSPATTPTSGAFPNAPSSPYSTIASPMSVERHGPVWGERGHSRRLSVPSGGSPFQMTPSGLHPHSFHFNPLNPSNASRDSSNPSSLNSSLVTSPTSSVFSRTDSTTAAEAEWRRRTWHPSTYSNYNYQQRPATSGLVFHQTPDAPRPAFAPQAASAASQPRLPGFETFDQISQRPATPTRPANGPGQPETPTRVSLFSGPSERSIHGPNGRRGHLSWDMSLHQNLTKLDIAGNTPTKEAPLWARQGQAERPNSLTTAQPAPSFISQTSQPVSSQPLHAITSTSSQSLTSQLPPPATFPSLQEPQTASIASNQYPQIQPVLPQRNKRAGWYNGPIAPPQQVQLAQRTSPEDSSSSDGVPTPSTASLDYQPSIVHANGYIESQATTGPSFTNFSHPIPPTSQFPQNQDVARNAPVFKNHEMSGLEALVAVATSEEKSRDVAHPQ